MKEIKVLLADDHQLMLDGIKSFLERADEHLPDAQTSIRVVATAQNGERALELLEREPVDVAVLDIGMPVLDGLETARRIRQRYPAMKVLLVTMEGDGHFVFNALRAGVHGYIVKEKSQETLIQAIRQVYHGSTYYSPDVIARATSAAMTPPPPHSSPLTERERELLCHLARNPEQTAEEIGRQLNIAMVTVQTHFRNIKSKLGMRRSAELVKYAVENKLC